MVAALVGGGLLGIALFVFWTWRGIEQVVIERPDTVNLAAPQSDPSPDDTAIPQFRLPPVPSATDGVDTFLLVGSDDRSNLDDLDGFGDFEGARADVLLLLIRPRDQGNPAIVSLPRDLWVSTPCGQERINEALEGCEGMNGESTLLVTVESLTGLGVDHLGLVDLAGFQEVVDDLGGYEICVENPVRDEKAALDLPAGCRMADGADTLAWLRSRTTEELTDDGNWVLMSGVSDLTRNERQREFLVEMLSRLSDFTAPQDALSMAQSIAPHVTVDSGLGLTQAVSLAWTMRGLGKSIEEIEIPVADYTTQGGANVLVATADIARMIAEVVAVETVGQPKDIINAG
ncbi:MAG: LCP family protein [Acidimicrobiia bacterium]